MTSFIMITWNRKAFVERLMKSFYKNVSCTDFEFIILDNGSTDGTVEFLKRTARSDDRIKLLFNRDNKGLGEYKRLYKKAKGDYIVTIDDDVISFPAGFDGTLVECLNTATDFGLLALDVVQNELTNGAKPEAKVYREVTRGRYLIEHGPTGGWCCVVRAKDFKKIRFRFYLHRINMETGEDGTISRLMSEYLKLKSGIIKDEKCLHACGPRYSKEFGYLDRDIEKYELSNLSEHADYYKSFKK